MTAPVGWEGILDEGEEILWQGRPDGQFVFRMGHIATSLFGLVFAGFALVWMILASQAGGFFWMFGLIHFSVGVGLSVGPPIWSVWSRRHTWYTLTNEHAFIATDIPMMGRKLKSYQIDRKTRVTFESGNPASIFFCRGIPPDKKRISPCANRIRKDRKWRECFSFDPPNSKG